MTRPRVIVVGLALVGGLVAGCGSSSSGAPGAGASSGSAGSSGPVAPSLGVSPSGAVRPTATAGVVTVRGRLTSGVEGGCILLTQDSGGTWVLIGGDRGALVPGRRVQVIGEVRRGIVTTCQQGTSLYVRSVTTY